MTDIVQFLVLFTVESMERNKLCSIGVSLLEGAYRVLDGSKFLLSSDNQLSVTNEGVTSGGATKSFVLPSVVAR